MHDRIGVVKLLLRKGVNPAARDFRQWTSLHWAAHYGYTEMVRLLLEWKAPLEVANEFGGTPLNQTIWTTLHERFLPEHVLIIEMLIKAGAQVDAGWMGQHVYRRLNPRVAELLSRGTLRKAGW